MLVATVLQQLVVSRPVVWMVLLLLILMLLMLLLLMLSEKYFETNWMEILKYVGKICVQTDKKKI